MRVKNCPECGKMFAENAFGMCEKCKSNEESGFAKIKEYVDEHPNCTVNDLCDATGVKLQKIMAYIKEGRLLATPGMANDVTCRACGGPRLKGNFCEPCSIKLNKEIMNLYKPDEPEAQQPLGNRLTGQKMSIRNREN